METFRETQSPLFNMRRLANRLRADESSKLEEILVIGIDFGTTYSGAAWATMDDFEREEINLITSWPGYGRDEGKAPTTLFYDEEKGDIEWGYSIPPDVIPLQWFKLLLLRKEDMAPEVEQSDAILKARQMLKEHNTSAVDVIADYLRVFWEHILDTIRRDRSESVLEAMQLHVVITVPAIWKGYARQKMKEAATKAGILDTRMPGPTTLSFAPEPEAAALAALCEKGRPIEEGNVYVVCDAGGGTVDLVIYQVTNVDPIELYEVGIGTGGLCGGIFVDDEFQKICQTRLGRIWNKLSATGIKEIMKTNWESGIKPQFKPGNNSKEYIVPIPAEAWGGSSLNDTSKRPFIKNGRIHFSSNDIQKAFTKVFSSIKGLIDDQLAKANVERLTGIIMVGGLGSSLYLYEYLNSIYLRRGIQVLQSTGIRPRTAISRGAVFKGFLDGPNANINDDGSWLVKAPVSVVSSVARQSIGIRINDRFDPSLHRDEDMVWDNDEGVMLAKNQMQWFIKKGEHVSRLQPITHHYSRTWARKSEYDGTIGIHVFQCELDVPPSRCNRAVKQLCQVACNVGSSFHSLHDYQAPSGNILKEVVFDVKMVPSGASVEFSVLRHGRRLNTEDVNIKYQ